MNLPAEFLQQLRAVLDDNCILEHESDRWSYGFDNSRRHALPDLVIQATTTEQVQHTVRLCHQFRIPLVARGRATGTTGAAVPDQGGVVLSLERMNRILNVDPANRLIQAQPGVTNREIQMAAAEHGFFWPPDPTSAEYCTIGGNLAYNSAGPRAVKYGTPRENTLGLTAVMGTGELIKTGVMTTKGVVGYDLTRLLIGSEGTLAIITEATLKLTPLAEKTVTLQASYRDIGSAAEAVTAIMAQAVIPCSLEFIDNKAIDMIRDYADMDLPVAGAMLMIEVDGTADCIEQAAQKVAQAAQHNGLISLTTARDDSERDALWRVRKALSPALRKIAPKKINEDVVVPVSRIAELLAGLDRLSAEYGITIVNFGHAGNGNIHVNLLVDPDNPEQMQAASQCLDQVFDLVLSLEGTLSGEHGVGLEKRDFINREIDATTLQLMRQIKQQFDPHNILNPGKMLPR